MADAPDKPVYLITGSDGPKVETALKRLRVHFEPEAIESVSALDTSGEETVGLCNAGSLFGDGRLIVVRDVDGYRDGEGRLKGGWKAADVDAMVGYLAAPAPATVLALAAAELKASSALWKACAKAGRVLSFDVDKKELHDWVEKQFNHRGVRPESEAVTALIELVGEDLRALSLEVDKVATWASGEPVGEREVTALVEPSVESPGWELAEAWVSGNSSRTLAVSENRFERSSRKRRDLAPMLSGSLAAHLARLRAIKRLASDGVSSKEIAARLKLKPFHASKLYRQAEGFSDEDLDDAVVRLAELDGALKGQSRLAPDLELQRTLVDLTRRPGVAPASGRAG